MSTLSLDSLSFIIADFLASSMSEYHEDTIHHVKVKKGITILFSKTLKLLQHKHLQLDDAEFIYSNDASNNLCNVLEAVFLHGLKDSVTQKLTAYVGLAASSLDTTSGLNFWNVAAKFTHKDVIVQLQSLSQITTPIGWCRAWVRMALNDGLMQSYLHSMIVDVKTLKYFYHSFAYLRDFEQPGILNNLLTGLMSLEFKLSYNSSVLNTWNNGTLQIAGQIESQVPPSPTLQIAGQIESQVPPSKSITAPNSEDLTHTNVKVTHIVSIKPETISPSNSLQSDIMDNLQCTRHMPSHTNGDYYLSISDGSTCSCPDQGETSQMINSRKSPVAWLDNGKEKSNSYLTANLSDFKNSKLTTTNTSVALETQLQFSIPRGTQIDEEFLKHSFQEVSTVDNVQERSQSQENAETSHLPQPPLLLSLSHCATAEPKPRMRNYEEICASLPPIKLDPTEQEDILKKVLQEFDTQSGREKNEFHLTESNPLQAWVCDNITTKLNSTDFKHSNCSQFVQFEGSQTVISEPINVVLSKSLEESTDLEQGSETKPKQVTSITDISNINQVNTLSDEVSSSGHYGNSLTGMSGWSSDIEPKTNLQFTKSTNSNRSRGESFASLLRRYTPELNNKAVTLDQVIGTLSATDEELVHESRSQHSSSGSQIESSRMLFLFQIPSEHGLSQQNFTCRGCSRPIGLIYGQPYLCEFDGGLYCFECHENYETYIPSSIIFNWDFRKKKVCKENFQFLQDYEDQALYDIELLNPKLYTQLPELMELKMLRQQLCFLKSYLFTCSHKMAESLRQKVWPREHLYERQDLYSITDFLQVQSYTLHKLVKELVKFASSHVYECLLCSQKGFVCEICRNPKVIYPFEVDTTIRCKGCKAVYHKTCMTDSLPCPKCERWGRRQSKSSSIENHPEDYGMSPT
ncbi:uncharacterized protein LOC106067906 isoform X3 [Biomphalaria glabrata]|uniref:Uncharacterized protein LOC106067906 isoform X3 n=1 Tax=Biomphalaria glabrata TaxID=6526 RepID=A0A9W2YLG9_BIOGL|nr:uncharacterized protein LOC106067906 isoform X3 [Biomphalaria glabrata]